MINLKILYFQPKFLLLSIPTYPNRQGKSKKGEKRMENPIDNFWKLK